MNYKVKKELEEVKNSTNLECGVGMNNPDIDISMKPINFYINRDRYKYSRVDLVSMIGNDLKSTGHGERHILYLYNTLDSDIMHGIVYVHQKIWPKYVQALKILNYNKIVPTNDFYVTNKESSIQFGGGRLRKPNATARMSQGPIEVIQL